MPLKGKAALSHIGRKCYCAARSVLDIFLNTLDALRWGILASTADRNTWSDIMNRCVARSETYLNSRQKTL